MKKPIIGERIVVSQSTTEAIRAGGWQDPEIKNSDGVLYVRFSGVKDEYANHDREKNNPVFKSTDGVKWERITDNPAFAWTNAFKPLKNGDKVRFTGGEFISLKQNPTPAPIRSGENVLPPAYKGVYTNAEMKACLGDRLNREIICYRITPGSNELKKEYCYVDWDGLAYELVYNGLIACLYTQEYVEDEDGVLYMPASAHCVNEDGTLLSKYRNMLMLRSVDYGKTWQYQGVVPYKDEYNIPNSVEVEGFMEASFEITDDGAFYMIMRSGSISPYIIGDDDHPAPKPYITYSYDKGKTWTTPEVFYDYGVLPRSTRLKNGDVLMVSGRPDVYVRVCSDGKGKSWSDPVRAIEVPPEFYYDGYWEYTCSNCGVCPYGENEAFLTYSDFQRTTPEGVRAKSIIASKVTFEEQ